MKDVQLIITDLDNIILRNDKSISAYTIKIMTECKNKGILFGVATARSKKAAKKYTDILEPDIIIDNGGASTIYKNVIIREKVLSVELSNLIISELKLNRNIGIISAETTCEFYTNDIEYETWSDDFSHVIFNSFDDPINLPTYKIPFEYYNKKAINAIAKKYSNVNITYFRNENWATFSHKEAIKESAVNSLIEHLDLDTDKVLVFGDDTNDIGMIKSCGIGVAVENAIPEITSIADYVCKSNNDDGVAHFIADNCLV